MVKITHNQNVLAWLLDNLDVVGMNFEDNEIYLKDKVERIKYNERLRMWETAVKHVIQFGWLC